MEYNMCTYKLMYRANSAVQVRWTTYKMFHTENLSWWRHRKEKFSALLALCEGNPPVTGGFP